LKQFLDGLRGNHAATDVDAPDPALRGRTYAIPFETVWQAAVGLAGGGVRGWSIESADDQVGVVKAHARGGLLRPEVDIRISIRLDRNAQTRVDLFVRARSEGRDLGRSRRLVIRFVSRLDRRLEAGPRQILDPRVLPEYGPEFGAKA
jgi:hypothetical protein